MSEIIKERLLGNVSFWVCLCTSIVLLVLGFIVPPIGNIEPSILTAVGELLGFATLAVVANAVREGYDARIKKGELEVIIDNNNKNS